MVGRARTLKGGVLQPTPSDMAVGYVLIDVEPGSEQHVHAALTDVTCVVDATVLFGDHDLIAKLIAPDLGDIAKAVVNEVRSIPGVKQTKTLAGADL